MPRIRCPHALPAPGARASYSIQMGALGARRGRLGGGNGREGPEPKQNRASVSPRLGRAGNLPSGRVTRDGSRSNRRFSERNRLLGP